MRGGYARGRGRVTQRAPTNLQLANQMRNMERRMTGHKTVPANNPPAFVQLPWNSFTFERTNQTTDAASSSTVTVIDVLTQIVNKVGLSTSPDAQVRIKVRSAQVWCTVAGTLVHPDMEVQFYELSGENTSAVQQPRSTQRDLGTLNLPAKVGYVFPLADAKEILAAPDAALRIVTATVAETGSELTTRIQVLWQSSPDTSRTPRGAVAPTQEA